RGRDSAAGGELTVTAARRSQHAPAGQRLGLGSRMKRAHLSRSYDVENVKQNDDRNGNAKEPEKNSAHAITSFSERTFDDRGATAEARICFLNDGAAPTIVEAGRVIESRAPQ